MEISEIEGVSNINVDLDNKILKVDFDDPALEGKIKDTLIEINYPAQD
jgi:hypothetical protein